MDYSKYLSKTATSLKPSGIRRFFDIAAEMDDCVSLGVGEPDFPTPKHVRDAAIACIDSGRTQYTSNIGLKKLRDLIARYLSTEFKLAYDSDSEIIITVGVSEAIDVSLRALLNPGDEVLIPEPSYVSYAPCVTLAGGVPVTLKSREEANFIIEPEMLENAITDKTKVVLMPYPNNPTGAIMTKEQLEAIVPVIQKHDLIVLSDEVYAELTYGKGHASIGALKGMKERTILLSGFSKVFSMTGYRIGYIAGPVEILKEILKIHQYVIMCAPTPSQVAAAASLEQIFKDDFSAIREMNEFYDRKRRFLYKAITDMGLKCFEPLGAFYMFPNVRSTGMNGEEFCTRLLREQHVALVPGNAFGDSCADNVRISYSYSMKQIEEAVVRMNRFMNTLKG